MTLTTRGAANAAFTVAVCALPDTTVTVAAAAGTTLKVELVADG